jgi:hypothetical protein
MTQGGEELVLCAICRFGSIAGGGKLSGIFHTIGHVADGELEDFGFLLNVQIAGQFHMTELTCIGRDLHIITAENSLFAQLVQSASSAGRCQERATLRMTMSGAPDLSGK